MIDVNCKYKILNDVEFLIEVEKISVLELAERVGISRTSLEELLRTGNATDEACEKLYAYAFQRNYRINSVKEEMLKERNELVLFHGSKEGLTTVSTTGSRENCDFGNGFYLGETYNQALSFVCEKEKSSIYSFRFDLNDLKIKRFTCDIEWMLAICYFRGKLKEYTANTLVKKVIAEVNEADVVIAPIADNSMFYIMTRFIDGDINADVALHSLSASKLGLQYIIKTEKALSKLKPIEKYYISNPERKDCKKLLIERSYEIDTKLKLAKREFKTGLYIEELLK